MTETATVLSPAARVLWRSQTSVQLELGMRRLLVEGVDPAMMRQLLGLPARSGSPPDSAATSGASDTADLRDTVATLRSDLLGHGYLWPAVTTEHTEVDRSPPTPRLAGELAALSVHHGVAATEVLDARQHLSVALHGRGRVGPHVAALLAAAGIGRVHALEPGTVRLHQACPGGARPSDEGRRWDDAGTAAILRAAPDADTTKPRLGERPDLVVLAIDEPIEADHRSALHARGCAHLVVRLAPDHGVIGPLVLPGLTSCLTCADLHRRDRDPAWEVLAVQLAQPHRSAAASSVALAAVIAGFAAMQALAFLDGGRPAAIEGTLELHPPDHRMRRRSWPPHPACDCMAEAPMG